MQLKKRRSAGVIAAHAVLYLVFFAACTYIYYLGATGQEESDLIVHFRPLYDPDRATYSINPYLMLPGYLVGGLVGASAMLSLYTTLTVALVEWLIMKLAPRCTPAGALVLAFMANFAIAIFVPFIHRSLYDGVTTGNSWHNSTYITMRLFALLAIIFYLHIVGRMGRHAGRPARVGCYLGFMVCVLAATAIKPAFYVVLAPTVLVVCVVDLALHGTSTVKRSLLLGGCLLVPLAVIASQYEFLFGDSGKSTIAIGWAVVWSHSSDNMPAAFLQSYAFPLAVLIGCWSQVRKDQNMLFAWVMFLFGFLEYVLLYETGERMYHANFAGSLSFATYYLMIASSVALVNAHPRPLRKLRIVAAAAASAPRNETGPKHALPGQGDAPAGERAYVLSCLGLYVLHTLSGMMVFAIMLLGKSYHWKWPF